MDTFYESKVNKYELLGYIKNKRERKKDSDNFTPCHAPEFYNVLPGSRFLIKLRSKFFGKYKEKTLLQWHNLLKVQNLLKSFLDFFFFYKIYSVGTYEYSIFLKLQYNLHVL